MSLRFYFGPSDAGRSRQLYKDIIARSLVEKDRTFLVIVPDQFTMQTQKELVELHERGGILNIDVLSFGRLSHRVLEEVGGREFSVLDDTGKSLVLQKVAADLKDELPTLGGLLHRQGYIHEVKSAVSEFMQYGLKPEDIDGLIDFAKQRGALSGKLIDLKTLYKGFLDYIHGRFVTAEETLDVLTRSLSESALIPGSVVVLDGFTGFTPVQNRLLGELMRLSDEVILSLNLGEGENAFSLKGEQELFYLTGKTVADMTRLANELHVKRGEDVYLPAYDLQCKELRHLTGSLFRYGAAPYRDAADNIQIFETSDVKEEVRQVGLAIRRLVRKEGLAFRDIAVILGDLAGYAPYVEKEFDKLKIPNYIDTTRGLILNPMVEYCKSALQIFLQDFSYESVFHYLRSGLADVTAEETDELDDYAVESGLRGFSKYSKMFVRKTASMGEDEEILVRLNAVRERMMEQLAVLCSEKKARAAKYVEGLYDFLEKTGAAAKLAEYEALFTEQGDLAKAGEYAQIYRLVMELLDQIYTLLGDEEITLKEFAEILEAGFAEIQVGTIPQNVDRVLVGDMERTRLKSVKVLFFMGVNDGNIPKASGNGGIISDMDREFLKGSGTELAPTPRQKMFTQRFYLYLNMTRPVDRLFISFARMDAQGKSLRPAYLVETLKQMFPGAEVSHPETESLIDMIETDAEGLDCLAEGLREFVSGDLRDEAKRKEILTVYHAYELSGEETPEDLKNAAFLRYENSPLSEAVAKALYGQTLFASISRLENYASCAYRHFLQYGLKLKERGEFGFERVDLGNVFHEVLEKFGRGLPEDGYNWFSFPEEYAGEKVRTLLENVAAEYGETVLYSSARNQYAITRMARILDRAVWGIRKQLEQGEFTPDEYEVSFSFDNKQAQDESASVRLVGKIDRIDLADRDGRLFVKVVDYKTGNKKFDPAEVYRGKQLQLAVYMDSAMKLMAERNPGKEVVPAAMLYYHVDDPVIKNDNEPDKIDREDLLLAELRTTGAVNADREVVDMLDKYLDGKSAVIPVEIKKDAYTAASAVLTKEDFDLVSGHVNAKLAGFGKRILEGDIEVNPTYENDKSYACQYCSFKKVCGFDDSIPGYNYRKYGKLKWDDALDLMREEAGLNGSMPDYNYEDGDFPWEEDWDEENFETGNDEE